MTWKSSYTIPIPSLSLCSPIQFLSNVTLIHFHCLCNPAGRAQRAVSLRSERSMSRGFPSLELDTVLEERSDPEQTQVRKKEASQYSDDDTESIIPSSSTSHHLIYWSRVFPSSFHLSACVCVSYSPQLYLHCHHRSTTAAQIDLMTPDSPLQPSGDELDDIESDS